MASPETLKPQFLYSLLRRYKASFSTVIDSSVSFPASQRSFSSNAQLVSSEEQFENDPENKESIETRRESQNGKEGKKSLVSLFKGAVGLTEMIEEGETETSEDKLTELKKKLMKIERELRSMKGTLKDTPQKMRTPKKELEGNLKDSPKKKRTPKKDLGLYQMFTTHPRTSHSENTDGKEKTDVSDQKLVENKVHGLSSMFAVKPETSHSMFLKNTDGKEKTDISKQKQGELSVELKPMEELLPETKLLIRHLHEKGYLKDANFLRSKHLDFKRFSTIYSRGYIKRAAEILGKDHGEMVNFLSECEVKRLALFGCPSVEKKTVFAAKRLRSYFGIQEDIICRGCKLNNSCKFKGHTVGKKVDVLDSQDVMKILTLYALELVPSQLIVPAEIKDSISILLKESVMHCQKLPV